MTHIREGTGLRPVIPARRRKRILLWWYNWRPMRATMNLRDGHAALKMLLLLSLHLIAYFSLFSRTSSQEEPSSQELNQLEDEAIQQLTSGNVQSGITLLKSVLARMESAFGLDYPPMYRGLDVAAKYYEAKGNPAEALTFRTKAQTILEKAKGPTSPEIAPGLDDLAKLYVGTKDYTRGETLYRRVLTIPSLEPQDHMEALSGLGDLYKANGNKSAAVQTFQQLVQYAGKTFGEGHTYTGIANLRLAEFLLVVGDPKAALPYAKRSEEILRRNPGTDQLPPLKAYLTVLTLYLELGRLEQAESSCRQAVENYGKSSGQNPSVYATMLIGLGNVLHLAGKIGDAEKVDLQAISINERAPGSRQGIQAACFHELASLYNDAGDLVRAESYYRRALVIYEKMDTPPLDMMGTALSGLASVLAGRGDYRRALPLCEQSIEILTRAHGKDNFLVLAAYWYLGFLEVQAGEQEKANAAFSSALALGRVNPGLSVPDSVSLLGLFAGTYLMRGNIDKAKELLVQATKRLNAWPEAPLAYRITPLVGRARVALSTGDTLEAAQLSRQAEDLIDRVYGRDHPEHVEPLICLSSAELLDGHPENAITAMTRALDIEEQNLNRILASGFEGQKNAFMATLEPTTNGAVSLHMDYLPQNPRALTLALETVLRRKGRVLEELARHSRYIRDELDPEDRSLVDRMDADRAEFAALFFREGEAPSVALQEVIRQKEDELQRLEAAVLQMSPAYAALVHPISVDRVRAALPSGTVLVEFVRYRPVTFTPRKLPPQYGAYVLRGSTNAVGVPLGPTQDIDGLVVKFREALRDPKRTDVKTIARSLDARIINPLRRFLQDTKHIVISPDGSLNLVPFEALVDPSGQYLCQTYSFTYATSGRDLVTAVHATSREGPIIMANPAFDLGRAPMTRTPGLVSLDFRQLDYHSLPGTALEATAIKQVLGDARIMAGTEATEQALKQVKGPFILHVATHGFFLNDEAQAPSDFRLLMLHAPGPTRFGIESKLLRSGLVLAGVKQGTSGQGEDGVVTALEISGLDLHGTQLVVLSACDTGVGDIGNSEGVYGLRRALVIAGSESQVLSLWPVSDMATRDLMVDFYKRLKAGETRSEALRQARLAVMEMPERAHPFYWAAFILSGDWKEMRWGHYVN